MDSEVKFNKYKFNNRNPQSILRIFNAENCKFSYFRVNIGISQMSYDLEQENKEILARYKDLISNTYRTLDEENNKLIRKAFDIALDAHKDQRRKSGNLTFTILLLWPKL
jgi:cation transport regulator ChaB